MSQDNTIDGTIEDLETTEPELDIEALKAKADLLNIKYSGNIGAKKLKEKIDLHFEEVSPAVEPEPRNVKSVGPNKTIREIEKEARKLMTVIITDNDPQEQSNPTIVHTVQNKFFKIGVIIRKDEEQDVPTAIVKALKEKTMIKWVNSINAITKRPTGNKTPVTKKRFNIQVIK